MPQELVGIGIENDAVFILLLVEEDAEDEIETLLEGLLMSGERVIVSELAILCRKLVGGDGELDNGSVWLFAGSFALGFLKESKRNI